MNFHYYKYIDDTDSSWFIKVSDFLADAGGLEQVPLDNLENFRPLPGRYKTRHIKLIALADRPGKQKYRADVITNERNPAKLLNKIITVNGIEMRCIKYVGEQRTAR